MNGYLVSCYASLSQQGVIMFHTSLDNREIMVDRIKELSESLVEPDNPDTVFAGNPVNFGWVWSTGWCNVTKQQH